MATTVLRARKTSTEEVKRRVSERVSSLVGAAAARRNLGEVTAATGKDVSVSTVPTSSAGAHGLERKRRSRPANYYLKAADIIELNYNNPDFATAVPGIHVGPSILWGTILEDFEKADKAGREKIIEALGTRSADTLSGIFKRWKQDLPKTDRKDTSGLLVLYKRWSAQQADKLKQPLAAVPESKLKSASPTPRGSASPNV